MQKRREQKWLFVLRFWKLNRAFKCHHIFSSIIWSHIGRKKELQKKFTLCKNKHHFLDLRYRTDIYLMRLPPFFYKLCRSFKHHKADDKTTANFWAEHNKNHNRIKCLTKINAAESSAKNCCQFGMLASKVDFSTPQYT